jgi:hypothetical protein
MKATAHWGKLKRKSLKKNELLDTLSFITSERIESRIFVRKLREEELSKKPSVICNEKDERVGTIT